MMMATYGVDETEARLVTASDDQGMPWSGGWVPRVTPEEAQDFMDRMRAEHGDGWDREVVISFDDRVVTAPICATGECTFDEDEITTLEDGTHYHDADAATFEWLDDGTFYWEGQTFWPVTDEVAG